MRFLATILVILSTTYTVAGYGHANGSVALPPCVQYLGVETAIKNNDLAVNILLDPGLTQQILSRRKGIFSAWLMLVPEIRSYLNRMTQELELASKRLEQSQVWGPRKLWLQARVGHMKLATAAAKMAPEYQQVLGLHFQFLFLMSKIATAVSNYDENPFSRSSESWLEGQIEKASNYYLNYPLAVQTKVQIAIFLTERLNVLFIPTFELLSEAQMNRMWTKRGFPIGATGLPFKFDGTDGIFDYGKHDVDHVQNLYERNTGNIFGIFNVTHFERVEKRLSENQLAEAIAKSAEFDQPILSLLDNYSMDHVLPIDGQGVTREEIEKMYFNVWHETLFLSGATVFNPNLKLDMTVISQRQCLALKWIVQRWNAAGIEINSVCKIYVPQRSSS